MRYDSILVVVCRLSKYAYFLPYRESSTTEDLVYAFLRTIIANYSILKELISDRDKLFISNFWRLLIGQLRADYKLSIAFYP